MRCLALAAALALALPVSAQTDLADGSGGYAAIQSLSVGSIGALDVEGDLSIGWRQANGLDYGVRVGVDRGQAFSGQNEAWVGPTAGYTRTLGRGVLGRVEGAALYQTYDYTTYDEVSVLGDDGLVGVVRGRTVARQSVAANVTATVARPVRLVGSVRLHPTLGGFVAADAPFRFEDSAYPDQSASARAAAGVHVGVPVSFRLFGQDVAVSSAIQVSLTDGRLFRGFTGPYAGSGLRLNF
ncbi:hypothetical protein [Rubrivirga sp.]|uniref:hypothetical protein n=1 Tax=Rubrivirga sp. TaxID=1885344 RepID=UPI003B517104